MIRKWLALLILLCVGTCLADDGIPLSTDFDIPIVVGGKVISGKAFVTPDKVMRIYYVQDGRVSGPILYTLTRGTTPQPPIPVPVPVPVPTPTPVPVPTPGGPLSVMVVYDTNALDNMAAGYVSVFTSKPLRTYLDDKCGKEAVKVDGKDAKLATWRFLSHKADVSGQSEKAQKWFEELKGRKLPAIKVSNGTSEFIGDLPDSPDAVMALLKKYAGG